MVWRRLPTYLPSFALRLAPLSPAQRAAADAGAIKGVRELVFKTAPNVGKVRRRGGQREREGGRRGVFFSFQTDRPTPFSSSPPPFSSTCAST